VVTGPNTDIHILIFTCVYLGSNRLVTSKTNGKRAYPDCKYLGRWHT